MEREKVAKYEDNSGLLRGLDFALGQFFFSGSNSSTLEAGLLFNRGTSTKNHSKSKFKFTKSAKI